MAMAMAYTHTHTINTALCATLIYPQCVMYVPVSFTISISVSLSPLKSASALTLPLDNPRPTELVTSEKSSAKITCASPTMLHNTANQGPSLVFREVMVLILINAHFRVGSKVKSI